MELEDGYSDEMLRYLVHNTTPDGVRFFLAALRSGTTVVQFSRSRLCRVVLGERNLPTLQSIYRHRQYLTSYYRLQKYYPYPENDMIHSCVAIMHTTQRREESVLVLSFQSPFTYFAGKSVLATGIVQSASTSIVDHRMHVFTFFTARYVTTGM